MALATPDEPEITRRALFKERDKVYPKSVKGRFRKLKWTALILLLSIYYITPWIRWDRGPDAPDQAILIDMTGRRAYFFFIEIWPQQVYFLTGILIVAAIGLFLATSLFGRVWCGYACPQTVWTDLFMWVERKIEGDRRRPHPAGQWQVQHAPSSGRRSPSTRHGSPSVWRPAAPGRFTSTTRRR